LIVVSIRGCVQGDVVSLSELRTAQESVERWSKGVYFHSIPALTPSQVDAKCRKALASNSSDEAKSAASKLLETIAKQQYYFAFAEHIQEFRPRIPEYEQLLKASRGEVAPGASAPSLQPPLPKCLAIAYSDSDIASAAETPPAFFDATIMETFRQRLAVKPSEVALLLFIEWRRRVIGQYEMTGVELGGQRTDLTKDPKLRSRFPKTRRPMYRHIVRLTVLDYPSGKLRLRREWTTDDPNEKTEVEGETANPRQECYETILNYLYDLSAGKVSFSGSTVQSPTHH
jgi:hypothetical protein